jgi:L-rhamnose isomerase
MMINQSIFTDDDNDIGSEEALTQLIINNKRILDTRIKDNTANKFVQMVEQSMLDKNVKLLRALCICNKEAVVKNQMIIS